MSRRPARALAAIPRQGHRLEARTGDDAPRAATPHTGSPQPPVPKRFVDLP
jgi:hypothetical protein